MSALKFRGSFFDSLFGVSETCRLTDIDEDSALSFSVGSLRTYNFHDRISVTGRLAMAS